MKGVTRTGSKIRIKVSCARCKCFFAKKRHPSCNYFENLAFSGKFYCLFGTLRVCRVVGAFFRQMLSSAAVMSIINSQERTTAAAAILLLR